MKISLEEKIAALRSDYLESLKPLSCEFLKWFSEGKKSELLFEAHKIKGSGACYGLDILSNWAAELELALASVESPCQLDAKCWVGFFNQILDAFSNKTSIEMVNHNLAKTFESLKKKGSLSSGSPNKQAA